MVSWISSCHYSFSWVFVMPSNSSTRIGAFGNAVSRASVRFRILANRFPRVALRMFAHSLRSQERIDKGSNGTREETGSMFCADLAVLGGRAQQTYGVQHDRVFMHVYCFIMFCSSSFRVLTSFIGMCWRKLLQRWYKKQKSSRTGSGNSMFRWSNYCCFCRSRSNGSSRSHCSCCSHRINVVVLVVAVVVAVVVVLSAPAAHVVAAIAVAVMELEALAGQVVKVVKASTRTRMIVRKAWKLVQKKKKK